jgi:hypothetical protein
LLDFEARPIGGAPFLWPRRQAAKSFHFNRRCLRLLSRDRSGARYPFRIGGNYIHLNPVRARIVEQAAAASYPWSSLNWLSKLKARPRWLWFADSFAAAGELADTPAGHAVYLD